HWDILDVADPADLPAQQQIYDDFEEYNLSVQLKLKTIEAELASQPVTSTNRLPAGGARGRSSQEILDLKQLDGSGSALIDFVDNVNRALESLKAQNRPQDSDFLYSFLVYKLDSTLRRDWEKTLKPDDIPTVPELMEFLEKEAWVCIAAGPDKAKTHEAANKDKTKEIKKKQATSHHGSTGSNCVCCNGQHSVDKCEAFLKLSTDERFEALKKKG
ncbi:unnamed protein product, partial [Allacma fusca]